MQVHSFRIWMEGQTIGKIYGQDPRFQKYRKFVSQIPIIHSFLEKVDAANQLMSYKPGKTGVFLMQTSHPIGFIGRQERNFRIPVRILDTDPMNVYLQRTDGGDWSFMHHLWPVLQDRGKTLVMPLARAKLINPQPTDDFLSWFTHLLMKSGITNTRLANRFFDDVFKKYGEELELSITNTQRLASFKNPEYDIEKFAKDAVGDDPDFAKSKMYRSHKTGPAGRTVVQFPNGWKWVSLDKGYCQEEGDAAGHCGNYGADKGDNILSLRDPKGFVHLTFTINDGVLKERKAPGNKKPQPYTYKYIIELLKQPFVKKIGIGPFLPEMDFQLTDLSPEELLDLSKVKPDLINLGYLERAAVHYKNPNQYQNFLSKKFGIDFEGHLSYDKPTRSILLRVVTDEQLKSIFAQDWASKLNKSIKDFLKKDLTGYAIHLFDEFWEKPHEVIPPIDKKHKIQIAQYFLDHVKHKLKFSEIDFYADKCRDFIAGKGDLTSDVAITIMRILTKIDYNFRYVMESIFSHVLLKTVIFMNNRNFVSEKLDDLIQIVDDDSLLTKGWFFIKMLMSPKEALRNLKNGEDITSDKVVFDNFSPYVIYPEYITEYDPDAFYHYLDEYMKYLRFPKYNKFSSKPSHPTDTIKERE